MDLSARWLLTVLCGIAFVEIITAQILMMAFYQRADLIIMTPGEIGIIVAMVFSNYFNRSDRKKEEQK